MTAMNSSNVDAVLKDFRRKVCDCVVASPLPNGSLQLSFPCLKTYPVPLRLELGFGETGHRLSDNGLIQRQLEAVSDPRQRLKHQQLIDAEAVHYGIERQAAEYTAPIAGPSAGDALSRLLQFLSRCDALLCDSQPRSVTATTRDLVWELLIATAGARGQALLDSRDNEPKPDGGFRPIRVRASPPWEVLVIETDRDAHAAIAECEKRRLNGPAIRILAIFQSQLRIKRKFVARLSDLVDRQFSTLQDAERIAAFLREAVFAIETN